jgi:hypothetical protein
VCACACASVDTYILVVRKKNESRFGEEVQASGRDSEFKSNHGESTLKTTERPTIGIKLENRLRDEVDEGCEQGSGKKVICN